MSGVAGITSAQTATAPSSNPSASFGNERPRVTPLSLDHSAQRRGSLNLKRQLNDSLNSMTRICQSRYNLVVRFAFRSHNRSRERGTAAVEFSLVVPILRPRKERVPS